MPKNSLPRPQNDGSSSTITATIPIHPKPKPLPSNHAIPPQPPSSLTTPFVLVAWERLSWPETAPRRTTRPPTMVSRMHDFSCILFCLVTILMVTAFKRTLPTLMYLLETEIDAIAGGWGDLSLLIYIFIRTIIQYYTRIRVFLGSTLSECTCGYKKELIQQSIGGGHQYWMVVVGMGPSIRP